MRIRRVTAHAFGPLHGADARAGRRADRGARPQRVGQVDLARRHLRRAVRPAPGPNAAEDRSSRDRHRPWDRDDWEVSAEIVLDDGRRVELRHDLAGRVDCHAKDLDARHGLTRRSDQSARQVPGRGALARAGPPLVRGHRLGRAGPCSTRAASGPTPCRSHLQRAAATAGADETAAGALGRIDAFRQRAGRRPAPADSTRPLRRAIVAEDGAGPGEPRRRPGHAPSYEQRRSPSAICGRRRLRPSTGYGCTRRGPPRAAAGAVAGPGRRGGRTRPAGSAERPARPTTTARWPRSSAALAGWRSLPDSAPAGGPGPRRPGWRCTSSVSWPGSMSARPPVPRSPDRVRPRPRAGPTVRAGRRATRCARGRTWSRSRVRRGRGRPGAARAGGGTGRTGLAPGPGRGCGCRAGPMRGRRWAAPPPGSAGAGPDRGGRARAHRGGGLRPNAPPPTPAVRELGLTADPEVLHLLASGQAGAQRDGSGNANSRPPGTVWPRACGRRRPWSEWRSGPMSRRRSRALATWLDAEPDRAAQRNRIRDWRRG